MIFVLYFLSIEKTSILLLYRGCRIKENRPQKGGFLSFANDYKRKLLLALKYS